MDILTAAGQRTLADEQRAQQIFESSFPGHLYVHTPKDRPADIDAFIVKDQEIRAVVETKCRYNIDLQQFNVRYKAKWLVTQEKIQKAQKIADALCVPLIGFLYLAQNDVLLMVKIYENGQLLQKITVEETVTQRTVNGGVAIRENAFIDMSKARVLKYNERINL